MPQPYAPISCDSHDELELLCMRGAERAIRFKDGTAERSVTGRCRDLLVSGGEEFLVVEAADGRHQVRLDSLLEIAPLCH